MAQLMDHVTYLSKEIGPRPAGTEEEQRAALYITEQFQKETGFTAAMEDFSSSSNVEAGLAVMAGVVVVVTLLAMIFPLLATPAFILAAAAAAVYSLEEFDRPIISRILSRGASQNVVAKYVPGGESDDSARKRGSTRKIVLMAHYDTGNVTPPLVARLESMKIPLALICVGGIIAAAFFLLIRIFIASGGGMGVLVLNMLSIVALILCLYPIVKALLIRTSPYNEGAINNATGTAALIEVARRIARGSVSEAELADVEEGVVIHGEQAAREAGLIPEGVQLVYEAEEVVEEPVSEDYDEEERLLSAKAAIAALTGKPVENKIYSTIEHKQPEPSFEEEEAVQEGGFIPIDNSGMVPTDAYGNAYNDNIGTGYDKIDQDYEPLPVMYAPAPDDPYAGEEAEGFENAPSWFIAAQQNARKPESERAGAEPQIKRSRYTEAITNAERSLAQREAEMLAAKQAAREEARRAREAQMRAMLEARDFQQEIADQVPKTAKHAHQDQAVVDLAPVTPKDRAHDNVPLSPDSTIAMPAPTPSAEIIAEALAADAAQSAEPQGADAPKPVLDASSVPVPPQEETAHNRMASLPSINLSSPYEEKPAEEEPAQPVAVPEMTPAPAATPAPAPSSDPSKSSVMRKLRSSIPSLSGLIAPMQPARETSSKGSASDGKGSASSNVDYNMEVPIEAEAAPQVAQASTPAPVPEPNAVEIPRSRSGSLLSRLRHGNEEKLNDTPQQWLDVDQDFDPRAAGRDRGGWESFRDDQYFDDGEIDDFGTDEGRGSSRRWQGGAYSRVQLGHVSTLSGENAEADTPLVEEKIDMEQEKPIANEIEQIYHFRNPQFNTEIWFVAVGADGESHDGARAFLEEHRDELRGSLMIEVESLGAGDLSVASEEGRVRKAVVSSRIKRYTREATQATGVAVSSVSLVGTDSIASTLQKAGFQAMHIFGAEDNRPALKGSADDVVENVDEAALEEHVGFIYELLKR